MEIKTRKNYDFFECSSAMQKCIRRGLEKDSLFFAIELYATGYREYVWKRLFIIASEDIGLANPQIVGQLKDLYFSYDLIAKKDIESATMPLIQAIILLCRSDKSRMIDEYKIFLHKSHYAPEIPDFALDVHTRRGKIKGRNLEFFINEGSKINKEIDTETPKEIKDFFTQYLRDYDAKKVEITGYDKRNICHKSIKDCAEWKKQNSQQNLF